jgi:hypothetical protein
MKIAWLVIAAAVAAAVAATVAATPALAADPAQGLCKGQLVMVRTSKLKTPDARPVFEKAAKDNEAWYRTHGLTANQQIAGTVLVMDPATHTLSVSPDTVATVHVNPPGPSAPAPDAAWNAFVDEYRASSDLETQTLICLDRPIR